MRLTTVSLLDVENRDYLLASNYRLPVEINTVTNAGLRLAVQHIFDKEYDSEFTFLYHYMHTDGVKDIKRVALSISLNDDYEGGKFQVFDWHYGWDGEDERGEVGWKTVEQKIGMMTLIPVIIPHRVTKVKGTRYQLISWFLGDKLNW